MKTPKITPEEIGIIKRAQAGDESAFNTLYNRYSIFVKCVIRDYLKDDDESAELTNTVFLKVYNKLSSFDDYSSFGGWLRVLAKHAAIDYLREMKNKLTKQKDDYESITEYDSEYATENEVIDRITYNQIVRMFENLKEPNRKVFKMFYENNMTVEQISNALNIPIGTIKSILSRTRRKLVKQLKI